MTNIRTPGVWIGRAAKQEKYYTCTTYGRVEKKLYDEFLITNTYKYFS